MKIFPFAASSRFDEAAAQAGVALLKEKGHEFLAEPKLREAPEPYLNGSDEGRLAELEQALASDADILWAARGGYGLTRLLTKLDAGLRQHDSSLPVVVGMSDVTALLFHLWAKYKKPSLHAPMLTHIAEQPAEVLDALDIILMGRANEVPYPDLNFGPGAKAVKGTLMAGNLATIRELVGTPSMPSLSGCILVVEDIAEPAFRLDRLLTHLWNAGVLEGLRALVVGHLTKCGEGALEALTCRCDDFGIPCFTGFPTGHEVPCWPLPVGVQAEIQIGGQAACLKVLEPLNFKR